MGAASSVSELLDLIRNWYALHNVQEERSASGVWYRGMSSVRKDALHPGVYRQDFSDRSARLYGNTHEEKRLNLEREMLSEFRTTGAKYFDPNSIVDVYFMAQHFGMPTRLLDWTTNPLAALFFAAQDRTVDGEVFVMEVLQLLPDDRQRHRDFPKAVATMRHRYVTSAIGESFWLPWQLPSGTRKPWILPVRPDNQPGRIGQQSSCFTLHMHESEDCTNATLARFTIPAKAKADGAVLKELRQLNINEFTIYDNLDHLSSNIKNAWGVARPMP
jgi:hypothetical protein